MKIGREKLRKYFPKDTTRKQMEDTIIRLLERELQKKRSRDSRYTKEINLVSWNGAEPMARAIIRPKITVQAAYTGDKDMQEVFISLLVSEVRKGKNSVRAV